MFENFYEFKSAGSAESALAEIVRIVKETGYITLAEVDEICGVDKGTYGLQIWTKDMLQGIDVIYFKKDKQMYGFQLPNPIVPKVEDVTTKCHPKYSGRCTRGKSKYITDLLFNTKADADSVIASIIERIDPIRTSKRSGRYSWDASNSAKDEFLTAFAMDSCKKYLENKNVENLKAARDALTTVIAIMKNKESEEN